MNIKLELLKNSIHNIIDTRLNDIEIDVNEISQTTAIKALCEIQKILKNDSYSDFEVVDKIVDIFQKYNLDFGNQHDF